MSKKAILEHIDNVVWPALSKYFEQEKHLSSGTWRRQKAVLLACEAVKELYQLTDFVKNEKLPSLLFAEKNVDSAIKAKCKRAADVSLFRDVADAFRHIRPDVTSTTVLAPTDMAPISMSFGRTHPKEQELFSERVGIVITDRNGEIHPLSSVLQNVLDAWIDAVQAEAAIRWPAVESPSSA
jgi:hypothetical protein